MPPQLKGIVEEEKFAKSQAYGLAKRYESLCFSCSQLSLTPPAYLSNFAFVSGLFEVFITVGQAFYLNVALWDWICDLCSTWALQTGYVWLDSDSSRAAVASVVTYLLTKVIHLPFSWYSTFVLEARHNFNQTTYGTFIGDMVKETLVYSVTMVPILTLFLKVIEWGGRFFYICAPLSSRVVPSPFFSCLFACCKMLLSSWLL